MLEANVLERELVQMFDLQNEVLVPANVLKLHASKFLLPTEKVVDGSHSDMGADEVGGLDGDDFMGGEAKDPAVAEALGVPGQSPATDSSMNRADVRNHAQESATQV